HGRSLLKLLLLPGSAESHGVTGYYRTVHRAGVGAALHGPARTRKTCLAKNSCRAGGDGRHSARHWRISPRYKSQCAGGWSGIGGVVWVRVLQHWRTGAGHPESPAHHHVLRAFERCSAVADSGSTVAAGGTPL